METNPRDPESPCTSVCEIRYDLGICIGCYRTLNEIARWAAMTPEQRRAVMARVRDRRAASE